MAYTIRNASSQREPRAETPAEAIWRMLNLLVAGLHQHTHGGVSGQANTSAAFALPAAAKFLADLEGRDASGNVVAALGGGSVLTARGRGRAETIESELTLAINAILKALSGHTHAATAGGVSCSGWPLPANVKRIADTAGQAPDGSTVASNPLKLLFIGRNGGPTGNLVAAWNGLLDTVENHVHGGCTAGGASTGAMTITSGGAFNKVADADGRDADAAVVA